MCDLSTKIFQPEKHIYNAKYLIYDKHKLI